MSNQVNPSKEIDYFVLQEPDGLFRGMIQVTSHMPEGDVEDQLLCAAGFLSRSDALNDVMAVWERLTG
jgi:hypothetical protein